MISPQDSPQVKVAKGAAIIFSGLVFARLVNYAYQSLLSRVGGQVEFGLFFLGVTTLAVAGGIAALGIDHGVARFAPLYIGGDDRRRLRGMMRGAFLIALVNGTVAGVLLSLLAGPLADLLFAKEQMTGIFRICALALPFMVSGRVLVKSVVAFQKIGYRVAVNQFASPVTRLVLTVVLLAAGMRAEGAMWAYAASEIISWCALLWLLQRRVQPIFGGGAGDAEFDFRPFITYCLPLFLSGLVVQVMNYIDAFMVGHFLDSARVGLYGAAARLAALVALGTELLNPLFLSITTGAFAQKRHELVSGTFNSNNRWFLYISLPIVCLLAIMAPEAMVLVWGDNFAGGATVLTILAAGRFFYYLSSTSGLLLTMYARTKLILALNLMAAVVNFCLNLYLIPRYGIEGAAAATAVTLTMHALLTVMAARRTHPAAGLKVFFPRLLAAAVPPSLLAWAVKLTGLSPLPACLTAGILFCATFPMMLKLMGVLHEEDRRIWRQIRERIGMGAKGPQVHPED
ncbi:MAG: oligosaccharide flippase family protein [Candidatus Glassbacteria bacterium]|nr:oligosaccharide flippase family protein [Candidatus Glassbacteria bacterium]